MLTFTQAKTIFSRARNKALGAKLTGRFTRLVQVGGDFGVLYHNTVVVTIHGDGTYTLNTGGYQTKTTKDRINAYSPARVYQHKHVWYLGGDGKEYTGFGKQFTDGIRVNAKGK